MPEDLRSAVRQVAPELFRNVDDLMELWLEDLLHRLRDSAPVDFQPKQVNDPIWGTIELLPWEVGFLDTTFIQRLRGVKQLGLAQLVFPSANHGRLEHSVGVVGAVENLMLALSKQIERWNRKNPNQTIPEINDSQRYATRLAALFHDTGHGPFSHAFEPILEPSSPLLAETPDTEGWRGELPALRDKIQQRYMLNKKPSVSVAIAVAMVLSEPMHEALASDKLVTDRSMRANEFTESIVAAILGALEGPGASHLSAIVSSQVDADRVDYLARDAHHAGLDIGFDTDRLLGKLEILRVREENLPGSEHELRQRAAQSAEGTFLQLGIAASGFGSFEQMLIGRTFLYDRLYHHHKVRAAEAMMQRLILVAERDRERRLGFGEIFLGVGDETMLRIFASEVEHQQLEATSASAAELARKILRRKILHRAFAFRGRFIATPPGSEAAKIETTQNGLWGPLVKNLVTLAQRYALGEEIHALALRCCEAIAPSDQALMTKCRETLTSIGHEQIIVDLPESKTEGIRLLARFPNGTLRVPEFAFNPQKWTEAYELQKRTGYVFCPREVAPIVGLASKIVFLNRFGVVMAEEADGYIKAEKAPANWLPALVAGRVIDEATRAALSYERHSLLRITADDLGVPQQWLDVDADFAAKLSLDIQREIQGGLNASGMTAMRKVMSAMFVFVDNWMTGSRVTNHVSNEAELQTFLCDHLRARQLNVQEGTDVAGGELDLWVENSIIIENKFNSRNRASNQANAAIQARRYAIALDAQVVLVVSAKSAERQQIPSKTDCVRVEQMDNDNRRVAIVFELPFGALVPSRDQARN